VQVQLPHASLAGAPEHRGRRVLRERLGEEGQHVDAQASFEEPVGTSTSMRTFASTLVTK